MEQIKEIEKFIKAIKILKSDCQLSFLGTSIDETNFKKIEWVTGVNKNGTAITPTNCPHSEITWTKVKSEMDKL